ncbi:hypothetical protein ACH61_03200 [Rathayibacter tanaceti]|uniref:Uncharacterized protein n=1 Tax=Rathayibacter tanaceti TaxID=1671680 RepID=A0A166H0C4_9MICO|nr:hypothetical protein ACH61_03200 [Rathayibacter tanaceti]
MSTASTSSAVPWSAAHAWRRKRSASSGAMASMAYSSSTAMSSPTSATVIVASNLAVPVEIGTRAPPCRPSTRRSRRRDWWTTMMRGAARSRSSGAAVTRSATSARVSRAETIWARRSTSRPTANRVVVTWHPTIASSGVVRATGAAISSCDGPPSRSTAVATARTASSKTVASTERRRTASAEGPVSTRVRVAPARPKPVVVVAQPGMSARSGRGPRRVTASAALSPVGGSTVASAVRQTGAVPARRAAMASEMLCSRVGSDASSTALWCSARTRSQPSTRRLRPMRIGMADARSNGRRTNASTSEISSTTGAARGSSAASRSATRASGPGDSRVRRAACRRVVSARACVSAARSGSVSKRNARGTV